MSPQNVGGGATGVLLFNALASKFAGTEDKVILINPNTYFIHLPASARLVVSPELAENQVLIPYPDHFNTGNESHIQAKVITITDDRIKGRYVNLDNGEVVPYSVLVLTPGCIWDGAFEFTDKTESDASASIQEWRSRFETAQNIVLVGGGGVGVEIAGEIMDEWPTKRVTIVHGPPLLVNGAYPDSYRIRVADGMKKRGIDLILGDRLDDMEPKDGFVVTRGGKAISADLVVPTYGPRPNTKFTSDSFGPDVLTSKGYVKIAPTFQLIGHPFIFAAGDIIDWDEQKSSRNSSIHSRLLSKNVSLVLKNETTLANYGGSPLALLLTNGRNGGIGYIGLLWGITFGDWFSKIVFSSHLQLNQIKWKMGL